VHFTFTEILRLKKRTVLYHFLFWAGIYLVWLLIFRSYSVTLARTVTVEFCYLLFITADFYAVSNLIIPQFLLKKRYALFVTATIAVIALSAWLRSLVAVEMNRYFFHVAAIDLRTLYFNSVINISLWVLLVVAAKMLAERKKTQQELELLEKDRVRNELDYLKAQINPHALFNSLNTVYGHIDKSNKAARNILLQFSELLRYQLYDCSAEKVRLEKEVEYIKNYVAFQRLRKDEKLIVDFEIENLSTGLNIAPFLLVVIIENAFKFVSSFSDRENKIIIKICAKQDILHCVVSNTKEFQQINVDSNSNGIGISNLKRRLSLLYEERHELTTTVEDTFYQTNLMIKLA
jgi:two-component system LytT family sensor kinase